MANSLIKFVTFLERCICINAGFISPYWWRQRLTLMEHNKKLLADRMVNFLLFALQKVDCFHLGRDNRNFFARWRDSQFWSKTNVRGRWSRNDALSLTETKITRFTGVIYVKLMDSPYHCENLAAVLKRNERNIVRVVMEKVEPNGDLRLLDEAQLDKYVG